MKPTLIEWIIAGILIAIILLGGAVCIAHGLTRIKP